MRAVAVLRPLCALATVAAAVALAPAGAGRGSQRTGGVLIPSNPTQPLPLQGRTIHSTNWSGYAVTSKSHGITAVSGTFVVPRVTSSHAGFAVTWAGIGGYNTQDLIQAGTGEDTNSHGLFGKQYFAWYELLPNSEQPLHHCRGDSHCRVRPGNRIAVRIRNVGVHAWTISVTNSGHWRWSRRVHYSSSRTSAEWILEAPTVGEQTTLAGVGTVHFGPTSRYTEGGGSHVIAHGHPVKIVLDDEIGRREATPSRLGANGESFNDCAYHNSCPRP
jgi:Peptidase A4 family